MTTNEQIVAQPDITLLLDFQGVIREVVLANGVAAESCADWINRPWVDTVDPEQRTGLELLLRHARRGPGAGIGRVVQHFPSGLQLPVEYTAIRLGAESRLMAVGKQVRAVTELKAQLQDAQRDLEHDYWKLRDVETRYRLLFDAAHQAVITLDPQTLRASELNPKAAELLGLPNGAGTDLDLPALLTDADLRALEALVERVREQRIASGALSALGTSAGPWLLSGALIDADGRELLLLQIHPAPAAHAAPAVSADVGTVHADLLGRAPDGFVLMRPNGRILSANAAFADIAQVGSATELAGTRFDDWLERPRVDSAVIFGNVERFGSVRLLATSIVGALGTRTEVELSAVGDRDRDPRYIAALVRDVGRRLPASGLAAAQGMADEVLRIGATPLRRLVEETVVTVERRYLETALSLTAGNRTAAAQLLGLSRQSLHAKLRRYGLDGDAWSER
jgi:transcriptional regulator PpsR